MAWRTRMHRIIQPNDPGLRLEEPAPACGAWAPPASRYVDPGAARHPGLSCRTLLSVDVDAELGVVPPGSSAATCGMRRTVL